MIEQNKNNIGSEPNNNLEIRNIEKYFNFITKGLTPYLIILSIILGVYSHTLSFGFINLDDNIIIKTDLQDINKTSFIKEVFFRDAYFSYGNGYYRPILSLSFILNKLTTGDNLLYFHLTNIIIHIIFCCLLFYFLKLINVNIITSIIFSLIFAVHPLFVNAVVWIVARNDLLVSVFLISSFIMLIKYKNQDKITYIVFHFVFFILSLFSKEVTLVAPVIFIIYLTKFKVIEIIKKENLLLILLWILVIIPYLILRNNVIHGEIIQFSKFFQNLQFIPEMMCKFFIPNNLSGLPTFNIILVIFGILILLFMGLFIYRNRIKHNNFYLLFGILWMLIFSFPGMLSKFWEKGSFDYLECRTYLPLVGIVLILAILSNTIFQKKLVYLFFVSMIILFFGAYNYIYSLNYSDPFTFYDSVIKNGTKVALAYYNRAYIKAGNNDFVGAQSDYSSAIELKPDFMDAFYNRGIINKGLGNIDGALDDYNSAIKIKNNFSLGYNNRGGVKIDLGDFSGALFDFNKALEFDPNFIDALVSRGTVRMKLGDTVGAKADFFKALDINPNIVKIYDYLGLCKLNSKEYKMVIAYFDKTVKKIK